MSWKPAISCRRARQRRDCVPRRRHGQLEGLALVAHVGGELDLPVARPARRRRRAAPALPASRLVGHRRQRRQVRRARPRAPASAPGRAPDWSAGCRRPTACWRSRGNTTRRMPSSSATATACRPAAPPNAIITKSRGSRPFSNSDRRIAAPRLALVTASRPSAAASTARAERAGDVCRRWPARAAAASSRMPPPRKPSPSSRPSTRLASVTVGSRAAAAVAGRSRPRAGALRPDRQPPAGAHRGDRAAAGADGADLHHRQAHRHLVDLALRDEIDPARHAPPTRRSWCRPCRRRRCWPRPAPGRAARRRHCRPTAPTAAGAPAPARPSRCCTRRRSTAPAAGAACNSRPACACVQLVE